MFSALIAVSMFALSASGTEESAPATETKDQPAAAAQAKAKSPLEMKEYNKYRWKLLAELTVAMFEGNGKEIEAQRNSEAFAALSPEERDNEIMRALVLLKWQAYDYARAQFSCHSVGNPDKDEACLAEFNSAKDWYVGLVRSGDQPPEVDQAFNKCEFIARDFGFEKTYEVPEWMKNPLNKAIDYRAFKACVLMRIGS